tara:strand:+ start:479 stop:697 length:219 start_codon:yes stop_codon:yes gene_type:complete
MLVDQGLDLIKRASCILEGISNEPGVTSKEFYHALDVAGIECEDMRISLFMAATNIELSLELVNDKSNPTIH